MLPERTQPERTASATGAAIMEQHVTPDPPQSLDELAALYNAEYYQHGCGPLPYDHAQPHWAKFFGDVAGHLIKALQPRRVLDAGCALGFLVQAFWDRGIEAWGIDISPFAIQNVRRDMRPYCRVGSVSQDIQGHYDLVTCIEVLEHMPEAEALDAIRLMCNAADTIFFSSTPFDVEEPTHFNVRPLLYWLNVFQQHGFRPDLGFDGSFLTNHAMLLRRAEVPWPLEVLQNFAALLRARQEIMSRTNQHAEAVRAKASAETRLAEIERANQALSGQLEDVRLESAEHVRQADARAAAELDRLRQQSAEHIHQADARAAAELDHLRQDCEARVQVARTLAAEQIERVNRESNDVLRQAMQAIELQRQSQAEMARQLEERIAGLIDLQTTDRHSLAAACREISDLHQRFAQTAQQLAAGQTSSELLQNQQDQFHKVLSQLVEKLDNVSLAVSAPPPDPVRARVEQHDTTLDLLVGRISAMETSTQTNQYELRSLAHRLSGLQRDLSTLALAVRSILESRTWRTLVRLGGVMLHLRQPRPEIQK